MRAWGAGEEVPAWPTGVRLCVAAERPIPATLRAQFGHSDHFEDRLTAHKQEGAPVAQRTEQRTSSMRAALSIPPIGTHSVTNE